MVTTELVELALKQEDELAAMLYMAAYGLMLWVSSELLPITKGKKGDADKPLLAGAHSCLSLCDTELVLKLAHRKNRPRGLVLIRGC